MRFDRGTFRNSLLSLALIGASATTGFGQDPWEKPDEAWISLTGTVASTMHEAFTIDYGKGLITVEMDDWDWYDEANQILPGERVTVYGRIDDGLYEARTIEAGSVYVADRSTFFYANVADEEGDALPFPHFALIHADDHDDVSWLTLEGRVTEVDGREFIIDTGFSRVVVDTDDMPYNPMDDVGFQHVEKGQRVSVAGYMDFDFFEKDELKAHRILTLERDSKAADDDDDDDAKKAEGKQKKRKQKESSPSSGE